MEDRAREPVFPVKFINLTSEETLEFDSLQEMCDYLEFWDTDDPLDAEEALILDRYNRRVKLFIEGMNTRVFDLYDEVSIPEDELERMILQQRQHWLDYFKEKSERSFWSRLRRLFSLLWKKNE